MIKTVSCEGIRARKLARLWTGVDARRGYDYRYKRSGMYARPDILNFGVGRFAASNWITAPRPMR